MLVIIERQVVIGIILKYPDFTKEFAIKTDASQVGLGAVLTQEYKIEGKKYLCLCCTQVGLLKRQAII